MIIIEVRIVNYGKREMTMIEMGQMKFFAMSEKLVC